MVKQSFILSSVRRHLTIMPQIAHSRLKLINMRLLLMGFFCERSSLTGEIHLLHTTSCMYLNDLFD